MKKVLFILCISAVVTACGGNSQTDNGGSDSTKATNQTAKAMNSDADTNVTKNGTEATGGSAGSTTGASLMASSDCNTCHKVDTKVVGPAFQDVAAKYEPTQENIDKLAAKVIAGGSGNWGNIPMSAHPNLSVNDAKEMVKYVLSLKK